MAKTRYASLTLGALVVALAVPTASASLDSGGFLIKSVNEENPEINATFGAAPLDSENPGGENPDPGEENPDPTVISSFTCGDFSFDITKGMVDWSDKNKASHAAGNDAAVKPYPDGGWNYMLSANELGSFLPGGQWGPTVEAYAFSKEASPTTAGTWDTLGFSTQGFHNSEGPALVATLDYGFGGNPTCSYAKAKDGLAQGDSATDPALFSKNDGGSNAYFMTAGKLVSSQTNPAYVGTTEVNKVTAWAKAGTDWNRDVIGHPKNDGRDFDWALLDRGSKPGKLQEEKDGTRYEFYPALTRSSTDYFVDRFVYRADGTLSEYSSEHVLRDGNGSNATQVKPASKIDGPALIRYDADGSTVTEAHYFWEGGSATDQASYERAGGTGWIGYWPT